ncbi:MAG: hypothetical protein O2810_06850, partial [Bacteroidetes bacterium]|nr:hypothetical protein [Bacteroidota bacterium]
LGACHRVVKISFVGCALFATKRSFISSKYTTYSILMLPFATVEILLLNLNDLTKKYYVF